MRTSRPGAAGIVAVLAALALVAAACADRDDGSTVAPPSPSTSTTAGPGAGGGPGGSGGGAGSEGTGVTTSSGGSTGGVGGPSATTLPPDAVIPVGAGRVGEVGPALLRPGRGDRVVIEASAQAGAGPGRATLDHLVAVLRDASGKRVDVDGVGAIGGGARRWTQRDLISTAASAARVESGRRQVVLRLLFVHGSYEGDTGVLGVAVSGDVAAIFTDQVDSAAGLLVSPAVVEDAVATHEVGHLLGLVDLVLHTGRADPEHPGHSRNTRSVMYWQVESDLVTQLLDGGIPRDFDADDRADLAAIRSG